MPVKQVDLASLNGLGMTDRHAEGIAEALRQGRGIIFVCGTPGSGRRSAMYSLLCSVNDESQSLLAADTSIQGHLEGVSLTHIEDGESLEDWLQLAMRLDADVIMVQPLEDIADVLSVVRASTRTVVVAGSGAESSLGPLMDLAGLGATPAVMCRVITCIIVTRLVARLCPHCKREIDMPQELFTAFAPLKQVAQEVRAFESPGCSRCDGSGRRGVVGLYEVREVGPQLAALFDGTYSPQSLTDASLCATTMSLLGHALGKSDAGLIDIRDLKPVIDECPASTSSLIRFWEN